MNNEKRFKIVPLDEYNDKPYYDNEWMIDQNKTDLNIAIGKNSITRDMSFKLNMSQYEYNIKHQNITDSGFIDFGTIEYNTAPNQIILRNSIITFLNEIVLIPELKIDLGFYENGKNIYENVFLQLYIDNKEIDDNDKITKDMYTVNYNVVYSTSNEINYHFLEGHICKDFNTKIPIGVYHQANKPIEFLEDLKFNSDNLAKYNIIDKGIYINEFNDYYNLIDTEDMEVKSIQTFAIPMFIIKRRNNKEFTLSNWNGSLNRPDDKYNLKADVILESDLIDIRHKVMNPNTNWDLILQQTLDDLFREDLNTKEKLSLYGNHFGLNKHNTDNINSYLFYQSFSSLNAETGQTNTTTGTLTNETPTNSGIILGKNENAKVVNINGTTGGLIIEFYIKFDINLFNDNKGILELICDDGTMFGGLIFDKDDNRIEFFSYENRDIIKYYTVYAMTDTLYIDNSFHLITFVLDRGYREAEFYVDGKLNNTSYHQFHILENVNINKLMIGKVEYNEAEDGKFWTDIYAEGVTISDLAIIKFENKDLTIYDDIELGYCDILPILGNKKVGYLNKNPNEILLLQVNGNNMTYYGRSDKISIIGIDLSILDGVYEIWNYDMDLFIAIRNNDKKFYVLKNNNIENQILIMFHSVPYQGVGEYIDFNKDILLTEPIGVISTIGDGGTIDMRFKDYTNLSGVLPIGNSVDDYDLTNENLLDNEGIPYIVTKLTNSKTKNEYLIGNDYSNITSLDIKNKARRGFESFGLFKRTYNNDFLFRLNNSDNQNELNLNTYHSDILAMLVYCSKYDEVVMLVNRTIRTGENDFTPESLDISASDVYFLKDRPLVKNINLDGYFNAYEKNSGNVETIYNERIKIWKEGRQSDSLKIWSKYEDYKVLHHFYVLSSSSAIVHSASSDATSVVIEIEPFCKYRFIYTSTADRCRVAFTHEDPSTLKLEERMDVDKLLIYNSTPYINQIIEYESIYSSKSYLTIHVSTTSKVPQFRVEKQIEYEANLLDTEENPRDWYNPMKEWYPSSKIFPSNFDKYPMMLYNNRVKYIELCKNGIGFYRKYRTNQIDAPTNIVFTTFEISSDEIMGEFDMIKVYGGDIASDALESGVILDEIEININLTENIVLYFTRKDIKGW